MSAAQVQCRRAEHLATRFGSWWLFIDAIGIAQCRLESVGFTASRKNYSFTVSKNQVWRASGTQPRAPLSAAVRIFGHTDDHQHHHFPELTVIGY